MRAYFQARLNSSQEELNKLQSAERVSKRNLQLQLPDEIKRVVKRVEELERHNKDLQNKLHSLQVCLCVHARSCMHAYTCVCAYS